MIDLHCHILPGIDDGAPDLSVSLKMAEIAWRDGIEIIACTPHVTPGVFENDVHSIKAKLHQLMLAVRQRGIAVELTAGADAHIAPDLLEKLGNGSVPALGHSRYFLFETTHDVLPPRLEPLLHRILEHGYGPIFTHPERLSWIGDHYHLIERLSDIGVLLQVTAGSVTGRFGRRAHYWAERMLDEGRVDVPATDAHNADDRPPVLSAAYAAASRRLGDEEATNLVKARPAAILSGNPLPRRPNRVSSNWSDEARQGRRHGIH